MHVTVCGVWCVVLQQPVTRPLAPAALPPWHPSPLTQAALGNLTGTETPCQSHCTLPSRTSPPPRTHSTPPAGVQPDTVTYAILLTHFSRRLEWTQVAGLLEEMHGKGMAARTPIYAAYVRHLCTSGEWNRALSLYLVMIDLGAEVTPAIYYELIQVSMRSKTKLVFLANFDPEFFGLCTTLLSRLGLTGHLQDSLLPPRQWRHAVLAPTCVHTQLGYRHSADPSWDSKTVHVCVCGWAPCMPSSKVCCDAGCRHVAARSQHAHGMP